MTRIQPKTRVSEYFQLNRHQSTLDFVDVPIGCDVAVFLDPSRLRILDSVWAAECCSVLQYYFETLLAFVNTSNESEGIKMLELLSERNEFHLGLSRDKSDGRAMGKGYAIKIWNALLQSKASQSGLLVDLEDTCLLIEGIGPDRISDAVCNIIRAQLIKYTQDMCQYYGIPMTNSVDSGPIWDPASNNWNDNLISLPTTPYGKLILVPKNTVRHKFTYDSQGYYTHYLLPEMQKHELSANTALVQTLKDGRKRVTKKSLRETYGYDKQAIVENTLKYSHVLDHYRENAKRFSNPMSHEQIAEAEQNSAPSYETLLNDVLSINTGQHDSNNYENAIEKLLTAILFPSLTYPQKQHKIHEGRKRIDITYANSAQKGFFSWLSNHFPCAYIFVECKNYSYGNEVGNEELDQLSGRFSPSRGKVGVLVCRSVTNIEKLTKSCIDTAKDDRGYIIFLTDDDLIKLVDHYKNHDDRHSYPLIKHKFNQLIM